MSCEYAHAGSVVTLTGAYFADDPNVPLTVTFPGNVPAEIRSIEQETLQVVVPEGAEEGAITVSSIYGGGLSSFHYLDTRGMMFDFDGLTGLGNHGWHNVPIENDGTGISGNYIRLGGGATTLLRCRCLGRWQLLFRILGRKLEHPDRLPRTRGRASV